MNLRRLIGRLLAIAVIVGLVLAPLSRHAVAGMPSDVSMAAVADGMKSDMPCCPSKAPAPIGCDQCVLMAACMSQCFAGVSSASFAPPFAASGKIAPLQNDAWPEGLGHPPPEHPPRILV
jgi:hypothetical protein